jgi:hypothetical protein
VCIVPKNWVSLIRWNRVWENFAQIKDNSQQNVSVRSKHFHLVAAIVVTVYEWHNHHHQVKTQKAHQRKKASRKISLKESAKAITSRSLDTVQICIFHSEMTAHNKFSCLLIRLSVYFSAWKTQLRSVTRSVSTRIYDKYWWRVREMRPERQKRWLALALMWRY